MAIGVWQLLLVLFIVLILFGSGRLPQVMSDIGKGLHSLRKSVSEGDGGTERPTKGATNDTPDDGVKKGIRNAKGIIKKAR